MGAMLKAEDRLRITSVIPRVRCAGNFRISVRPQLSPVPVSLWRVAAFNLLWRGGVACVAAASGPWPLERLSGRPHRGHRFRAEAVGETLRVPTRLLFQEPLPCHRATPVASVAAVSGLMCEGTRATHPRGRLSGATCRRRHRLFRDIPRKTPGCESRTLYSGPPPEAEQAPMTRHSCYIVPSLLSRWIPSLSVAAAAESPRRHGPSRMGLVSGWA